MSGLTCKYCARLRECIKAANDDGCEHNDNFEGEKCCRKFKRNTNADRIRTMSDEELARFLTWNVPDCANYCDDARCGCKWNCKHGNGLHVIRDWLRQPVKEDA